MRAACAALVLLLPATAVAEGAVRSVPVAVYTKKAEPVKGLEPDEVSLKEDGKRHTVLGVLPDERPLDVALILDSGAAIGSEYRSALVDAAVGFWRALPPEARISVWTSGGRPSEVVPFGKELADAEPILQQVAPGGDSFTLDTIIDASADLAKRAAPRRFLVIVTDSAFPVNRTLVGRASGAIARSRATPMVLLVKTRLVSGQGWDTETIMEELAEGYGGTYDLVLTPLAAGKKLRECAADLASQYLVRYESDADEPTHPEVKVKRKGVRVRVGLSEPSH